MEKLLILICHWILFATKFANVRKSRLNFVTRSDPEYVKEACANSLRRLGIDTIDLYYCHRVDRKTPIEQTIRAMVELKRLVVSDVALLRVCVLIQIREGKIKYLGLSEISADTLRRAYEVHPIDAVQVEYSPFSLEIEDPQVGLLKACRELGVAVIAYSPLGRGLLTGAVRSPDDFGETDFRKFIPRYSEENFPKNLELVDTLAAIAARKKCTPGQLTLAWLMAQGDDIIPIP